MKLPRRPLVVVEDHLYHIDELLGLLQRQTPGLLSRLTVVCLDRPGPDTQAAVERWAVRFPGVLIVADVAPPDPSRQQALPPEALQREKGYVDMIADLLTPRGVLLQDIQLEPLRFLAADEWWETIYLASNVRGRYGDGRPRCVFMSNKRAFEATFGKKLRNAGFDEDDVLSKDELEHTLSPLLHRCLREAFPLEVERSDVRGDHWLSDTDDDAKDVSEALDLVLWEHRTSKVVLTGDAIAGGRVELSSTSHEATTWRALVEAHLSRTAGIPTHQLGERIAPEHALRAEQSNAASRHMHKLRTRLRDKGTVMTAQHCYRLAEHVRAGRVRRRPRSPL
ncbi:MAG: hypothetical protein ACRBN8_02040 [Nannocystales bacterium]